MTTRPSAGSSSVVSIRWVVVLPAQLGRVPKNEDLTLVQHETDVVYGQHPRTWATIVLGQVAHFNRVARFAFKAATFNISVYILRSFLLALGQHDDHGDQHASGQCKDAIPLVLSFDGGKQVRSTHVDQGAGGDSQQYA